MERLSCQLRSMEDKLRLCEAGTEAEATADELKRRLEESEAANLNLESII
jgi:hypothetical protein